MNNKRIIAKADPLSNTNLLSAAKDVFGLTEEEAKVYVEKWGEIFAEKLKQGYYLAFIKPEDDGQLDIEIYGHSIVDKDK